MAIKSQNSLLQVSTATAAVKTITGITAANPPVVTSAAHGLANGAVVVITGVVGMTQVNNRAFVVANQAANTFELKGVDGTGFTTYGSGGSATPQTMTAVGEVTSAGGFDGEASEIETTNLQSTAKEFVLGLKDQGSFRVQVNVVTDTGQAKLRSLRNSASIGYFLLTYSDATVTAFQAFVKSFSLDDLTPDSTRKGTVNLRCTYDASGDVS
jgi:hypothetical protein